MPRVPKPEPQSAYDRMVAEGLIKGPSRRQLMAAACPVPDKEKVVANGQQPLEIEVAA